MGTPLDRPPRQGPRLVRVAAGARPDLHLRPVGGRTPGYVQAFVVEDLQRRPGNGPALPS